MDQRRPRGDRQQFSQLIGRRHAVPLQELVLQRQPLHAYLLRKAVDRAHFLFELGSRDKGAAAMNPFQQPLADEIADRLPYRRPADSRGLHQFAFRADEATRLP